MFLNSCKYDPIYSSWTQIPDPELDYLLIPDLRVKKPLDLGSGSPIQIPDPDLRGFWFTILLIFMCYSGENCEGTVCLVVSAFYGLVSYTILTTALLSMFGVKVGFRHYRRSGRSGHSGRSSTEEGSEQPQAQLRALEGNQLVDLVTERRAPPTRENSDQVPFEEIMSNILRGRNMANNPFYWTSNSLELILKIDLVWKSFVIFVYFLLFFLLFLYLKYICTWQQCTRRCLSSLGENVVNNPFYRMSNSCLVKTLNFDLLWKSLVFFVIFSVILSLKYICIGQRCTSLNYVWSFLHGTSAVETWEGCIHGLSVVHMSHLHLYRNNLQYLSDILDVFR
jgi:hypothetical protein